MRLEPTEAERQLWGLLRDRRLADHKFRRQVPVGRFIIDFFCADRKLIVELDGSQHADDPTDRRRDRWLNQHGYRVLRVWNNDLSTNRSGVLDSIWHALSEQQP
jgi:very-short-patch-repair endonuclease